MTPLIGVITLASAAWNFSPSAGK